MVQCPCLLGVEYGAIVLGTFVFLVFSTFHLVWTVEFHMYGTGRDLPKDAYDHEKRLNKVNYHTLYMTLGHYFFPGLALMLFRTCCCYSRLVVMILHAVLTSLPLFLGIPGMLMATAVYGSCEGCELFYSFHSWLGLIAILLAWIQVISGLFVFIIMKLREEYTSVRFRARFTPYHFHLGYITFFVVVATIITGLSMFVRYLFPREIIDKFEDNSNAMKYFLATQAQAKISHLLFCLSAIFMYYTIYREDFRYRGRILIARDTDPPVI